MYSIIPIKEHTEELAAKVNLVSGTLSKELAELAELHRSGVLTDEEFTQAKNKLLAK